MSRKQVVPNNLENCVSNGHSPELDDDMVRKLFTCSGTNCTKLNIVYSLEEFSSGVCRRSFKPEMVHQVYGFNEMIYGFKDLKVDLYFLANSAKCYINISFSEMISVKDGHPCSDDIYESLSSWLPIGFTKDKTHYINQIMEEDFTKVYGTIVDRFEAFNKKDNQSRTFAIRECSITEPGFAAFHERFQCFLVWFIDAASQIDMADPNWMFLYIYEQNYTSGNKVMSYPVGFCTVYKFYNFPDKIRTRISQLFIMPSCQRMGLGTRLLKATYSTIYTLPNVTDITVEDPCPEFVKMRDLLDCRLLAQLDSFSPSALTNGFQEIMFTEANTHFKINKRQCRRLYEIFRVHNYQSLKEFTEICGEIEKNFRNIYVNCRKLSRKLFGNNPDKNEDSSHIINSIRDKDDLKEQMESYFKDIQAVAIRLRKRE